MEKYHLYIKTIDFLLSVRYNNNNDMFANILYDMSNRVAHDEWVTGLLNEIMYPVNAGGEKKMAFAEEEGKLKPSVNSDIQDKINQEMDRLGLDSSQFLQQSRS